MATTPIENYLNDQFCTLFCQRRLDNENQSQEARVVLRRSEKEQAMFHKPHHGVPNDLKETPELMNKCLQELHKEVFNIVQLKKGRSYYKQAQEMSAEYVRAQHVRFLRSKCYDAREAAKLLEKFFELKLNLFGVDNLARDIKMSDQAQEDIEHWKTGYVQVLPQRDLAGRKILFFIGRLVQEIPLESTVRRTRDIMVCR
jgi:hypothetical protein